MEARYKLPCRGDKRARDGAVKGLPDKNGRIRVLQWRREAEKGGTAAAEAERVVVLVVAAVVMFLPHAHFPPIELVGKQPFFLFLCDDKNL